MIGLMKLALHCTPQSSWVLKFVASDMILMHAPVQGTLTATTTDGNPSVTLTLTDVTPSVQSVLGNDGHPELGAFANLLASGPAQIDVSFVPGALSDASHAVAASISTGATPGYYVHYLFCTAAFAHDTFTTV